MEFHIHHIDALKGVAEELLKAFPQPTTFIVNGEMGAGKTTFIKQICAQLGAHEASSPTYAIVNEYLTTAGTRIFHFDLYRIKSMEEALDFGFEEYLDQNAYVFIEWPEKVIPLLEHYREIKIRVNGDQRSISF